MASAASIDSAPAIGIDLGTTYSCVGVFQHGTIEIIANNDYGYRTTPSCVAFTDSDCYVGETAKLHMATNPTNTVFSSKRLLGRSFRDYAAQSELYCWPFEVVEQENQPRIRVQHRRVSRTLYPQEISAMVLTRMKEIARDYLGPTVTKAVVTVPANFNNSQRQATKDAATIAGLDVLRIINEPTAAAIAYGLKRKQRLMGPKKRSLLIFDLGGGTLDVSVVNIKEGVYEVIATAGDTQLGGDNFDIRMVEHFAIEFKNNHGEDLTACKRSMCRLRMACETAKRTLTWNTHATINIACLFKGVDFLSVINRKKFEDLNADLFRKSVQLVEKALSDANMEKAAVDDVVLVGGSSRIPKIQELLRDFFDGKELCKDINPDEAVAYGAAVQAAILNGDQFDHVRGFRLQDVAPLSLGTGNVKNIMFVFIQRNTPIPARCTKQGTTMFDNQPVVFINVYEGEHPLTNDNNMLGRFNLNGIQIAPSGEPTIDITFDVDSNGILTVSAVDKSTGANNQLTITSDEGRLSDEEIRRMVKDAEKFKIEEEEEQQRSRISEMDALESCASGFQTTVESDKVEVNVSKSYRKEFLNKVDSEKFKVEEEEQQRSRISEMDALESCSSSFQTTVESDKVEGKVSKSYRKKFLNQVNNAKK